MDKIDQPGICVEGLANAEHEVSSLSEDAVRLREVGDPVHRAELLVTLHGAEGEGGEPHQVGVLRRRHRHRVALGVRLYAEVCLSSLVAYFFCRFLPCVFVTWRPKIASRTNRTIVRRTRGTESAQGTAIPSTGPSTERTGLERGNRANRAEGKLRVPWSICIHFRCLPLFD